MTMQSVLLPGAGDALAQPRNNWLRVIARLKKGVDVRQAELELTSLLKPYNEEIVNDPVVDRFGPNWRVLLAHLTLFGFIYPGERSLIPSTVMRELTNRLLAEMDVPTRDSKVCQGTLLSRAQYLVDVDEWGYEDARQTPRGSMSPEQIAEWTAAIDKSH